MNILEENPERFFHGTVRLEHEGGCFHPLRFTAGQVAHYDSRNEALAVRVRCQAGQTVEFATDSSTVAVSGTAGTGARDYFSLDLEVDDYVSHPVFAEPAPLGDVAFTVWRQSEHEKRRMRRFCVHLPHVRKFALRSVEIEDGAVVEPIPPRGLKLLCLGDSITQGMQARHPSNSYPSLLARWLGAELLNLGVGGDVFDSRSLDRSLPFHPDVVTVAFGANDWHQNLDRDAVARNVSLYVETLRSMYRPGDVRIVVVSPIWAVDWAERRAGGTLAEFGRAIRDAAAAVEGVCAVDGFLLVPHDRRCFVDGLHPNDEGFALYAGGLMGVLQTLIR